MEYCTNCGQSLRGNAFCTSCGQPAAPATDTILRPVTPVAPVAAPRRSSPLQPMDGPSRPVGTAQAAGFDGHSNARPEWDVPPATTAVARRRDTAASSRRPAHRAVIIAAAVVVVLLASSTVWWFATRPSGDDAAPPGVPSSGLESTATSDTTTSAPSDPAFDAASGAGAQTSPAASSFPTGSANLVTVTVTSTAVPAPSATTSAAPAPSPTSAAAASTAAPTSLTPTTATLRTSTKPTGSSSANPLAEPPVPITCGPGYIVQVASELSEQQLRAHVEQLIKAGHLPPNSHWAHTTGSCALFSITTDAVVLYTGPFTGPYDGCAARLHAPADAFIKGTTPDTAHVWVSCLCPADAASLPTVSAVGQTSVWVGELQRILGKQLNYSIPDPVENADAGSAKHWGTYTTDTRDAVVQFQQDHGLAPTGVVDQMTWEAIRASEC